MSLWSRLWRRFASPDALSGPHALEARGDFAAAATEYEREGQLHEALRLLLVLSDADPDPASRVRTLARALRLSAQEGDPPLELRARYGRARLDVLRASPPGTAPVWELTSLAQQLEEIEEFEAAAEAYGLAGDRNSQVRLLAASGKIEDLEEVLARENERTRSGRVRSQVFAEVAALTTSGQRREALRRVRTFADLNPADDEVRALLRSLTDRLVPAPSVRLEVAGETARYLLVDTVTIGRAGSTIDVASPMLSRRHLELRRTDQGPVVADLGTRNGTLLAGARLSVPVPVRSPLRLDLGGEVACALAPRDDGSLTLDLGGERYVAPLATSVAVGPWRLVVHDDGLRLVVPPGAPSPLLDTAEAPDGIDLGYGDIIRRERQGAPLVRVLP